MHRLQNIILYFDHWIKRLKGLVHDLLLVYSATSTSLNSRLMMLVSNCAYPV